ncbi:MAG: DUF423 domain-containing protein [Myxococcales bacterium]|jgi:uncharacterized membrane protein YgdD (TMEM256/DUF423 family)
MKANFVSLGAVCAALGIGMGAFGAHALRGQIGEPQLGLWETATRYWLVGSLGLVVFGVWSGNREPSAAASWAGWLLLGGSVLFSASLFALALGAPRILGAVTPLGGLGLIMGFLSFAWAAHRR